MKHIVWIALIPLAMFGLVGLGHALANMATLVAVISAVVATTLVVKRILGDRS